ncbi:hypothetical protein B296_00002366 [Ensete ventricosum]|uniref:Uncharacterized protein n=1 Tax=Ensete ventricosum TaxID=4639 RepID=A0A427B3D2_ENSVE|nr:hypothetical protein B296_00002366 [Ensete ventricosum]
MGRVSLEYGYQLALTRLQARHPGVEIELDPFVTLPEDANTSPTPALVKNFMTRWYVETTVLSLLSVGLPMMALYVEGSTTTTNDTNSVFDLGSSPTVIRRTVIPAGETESPVNPVNIVLDLVYEVVALLSVVTVVAVEAIVSSFVSAPDLCSNWVRDSEESLVSDLQKDLSSGLIERDRERSGGR